MITNGPKYGPGSNPGRFWHGRKTLQKNDLPKMLQKRRRKIFGIILLAIFFSGTLFFHPGSFFFIQGRLFSSRGPSDSARTPIFGTIFRSYPATLDSLDDQTHLLVLLYIFYIFNGTLAAMTRGRSARSVAVARSSVAIGASQLVVRLVGRGRSVGRGRLQPRGSRPVGSFGDDQV